jgi:hypothetical protein
MAHNAAPRPTAAVLLRLLALAAVAAVPLLPAIAQQPPRPDPLPLRRVQVPADRLVAELDRLQKGVLQRVPLPEFEDRVRKAADAADRLQQPPRLLEAHYRARLDGAALVGEGHWVVANPLAGPGVLPLTELNLALRDPTWDDHAALLADFDGKAPGLLVEEGGTRTAGFAWSLRGEPEGDGVRFTVQSPPCAVTALRLTLPAGATVTAARGGAAVTVTPGRTKDVREWHIGFAGKSKVEFTVWRDSPAGKTLLLAHTLTTQKLTSGGLSAGYDFDVEALHGGVRALVFDCDAPLQPYKVLLGGTELKDWSARPEGGGQVLTVPLREPAHGKLPTVHIYCEAALPRDKDKKEKETAWTSPGVRLRDARPLGETLKLHVPADVRLEKWNAKDFLLTGVAVEADDVQVLTLEEKLPPRANAARPIAFLKPPALQVLTRQASWWQVEPTGSTLTAEVQYHVVQGQLFRLHLRLPDRMDEEGKNWQLEDVQLEPKGLLRNRATESAKPPGGKSKVLAREYLVVDLDRALTPQTVAKLTVRLRSPLGQAVPAGGVVVTVPDVEPQEKPWREGVLAVSVDPRFQADPRFKAAQPAVVAEKDGPWGKARVNFAYAFRDKVPAGGVRLVPHEARLQARCQTEAALGPGGGTVTLQLQLEPLLGTPDRVDVLLSAAAGPWQVAAATPPGLVRGLRRVPELEAAPALLALGGRPPFGTAAPLLAARSGGERWRLTFAQPLTRRETVTLQAALKPIAGDGPAGQSWDVPLASVPGADRLEGEAVLHLVAAEVVAVHSTAVRAHAREGGARPAAKRGAVALDSWRLFDYGSALFPDQLPRLTVTTRALAANPAAREFCDEAALTTSLEPDGQVLHHFRFRLWHWRRHEVPVVLPPGATLLAVKVENGWKPAVSPQAFSDGVRVELPAPAGLAAHRFEIVYASGQRWSPAALAATLTAPAPQLPVPPAGFRRLWRLPRGVVPLSDGVRRLPDVLGGEAGPWWAVAPQAWHAGQPLLTPLGPEFSSDEWVGGQEKLMANAEAAWRARQRGADGTLGAALERLAFDHLKPQAGLVVDAAALAAAGLRPNSPLPPGKAGDDGRFWERVDLVYVPCRTAPLLTTRRQLEQWQALAGDRPLSEAITEAVGAAVAFGHDDSGRFRAVHYWLRHSGVAPEADAPAAMTTWEPLAGAGDDEALPVAREDALWSGGLTLTVILCLLAWLARRWLGAAWRFRLLLVWLAAAGLALFWLPAAWRPLYWGPALAGLAVALLWHLALAWPRRPAVPPRPGQSTGTLRRSGVVAAGAVVLAWLLLQTGSAASQAPAGPEPHTVLLLPPDDDGNRAALATPDLLKRLDELARQGGPPRGAVLLSARYDGRVRGEAALFRAEFHAECFDDKATLLIPINDVELDEGAEAARLPGHPFAEAEFAPTHPAAAAQGYTVVLRGRGRHVVRLRFRARLATLSDQREVRFAVPKLLQSRVALRLPASAQGAWAVAAWGRQATVGWPRPRLVADLGREGQVHLRWRQEQTGRSPPLLSVRETYFWDLRSGQLQLKAALQYTVGGGLVDRLAVQLPDGAEVRSVEVEPIGKLPEGAAAPRERHWEVQDNASPRQLVVDLHTPVAGQLLLKLTLVPRPPVVNNQVRLELPRPLQVPPERLTDGALAYRVDGLDATDKEFGLGRSPVSPPAFARRCEEAGLKLRDESGLGLLVPTRAYSFSRTQQGVPPALGVTFYQPRPHVKQDIHWHVRPQYADLNANLHFTSAGEELLLIEYEVPNGVTVTDVRGPHVRYWTRADKAVHIWLQGPPLPLRETGVALAGWMAYPAVVKAKPGAANLNLPMLTLPGAPSSTHVRLTAAPGLAVTRERLEGLAPVADLTGQGALSFATAQAKYGGAFHVRPVAVPPEVQILTSAEAAGGSLAFTSTIDYQAPPAGTQSPEQSPTTLTVRLRNWPAGPVQLEAPGAQQRQEKPAAAGERVWMVTLPPGAPRQYRLRLTGRSAPGAGAFRLPEVTVTGAVTTARWLAVTGDAVRAEEARGVERVGDADLARWPWPAEAERVRRAGQAWRVRQDGWALRLVPAGSPATPAVQVTLAEQEAAVLDGRRWVHQATYTLFARAGADVHLSLPPRARLLLATVDGQPQTPRQSEPERLWLPLPGGDGVRVLRLRWVFEDEGLEQPLLQAPVFKDVTPPPVLWTVHAPPGHRLGKEPGPAPARGQASTPRPVGSAARELALAEAELRVSGLLAEHWQGDEGGTRALEAAQRRFAWHCRVAAYLLAMQADAPGERGPRGQSLADWLEELRRQNGQLTRQPAFEPLRGQGEQEVAAVVTRPAPLTLPGRGTPHYWQGPSDEAPRLRLTPLAEEKTRQALGATLLLAAGLAAVGLLAYLKRVAAVLRQLLPEQLVLLAAVGWLLFGGSLVAVLLLALGLGSRLLLLTWAVQRWWQRRAPAAADASSGVGSVA